MFLAAVADGNFCCTFTENRGLLQLLNTQRRMISISWSLYENFQQFITRKVKTFTTKENCWKKISKLLNTTT